jgi:hypothetical protein
MPRGKKAGPNTQELLGRIEVFLGKIAPDVVKRLASAEMRAGQAEADLALIRSKLVALLSPDQIEMAKVCNISPEMYALEVIELWKDGRISKSCFEIQLKSLAEMKRAGLG